MADTNTLADFLVSLGFNIDKSSETRFKESVNSAITVVKELGLALTTTATATLTGVNKIANSLGAMHFQSQRVGSSVGNIKALQYAFEQTGGSAEQASGLLEGFASKLRDSPGYAQKLSQYFKVNIDETTDKAEALLSIGDKLAEMDIWTAKSHASSLGIDEKSLLMLRDPGTRKAFAEQIQMQKDLGVNYEESAKKTAKYNEEMTKLFTMISILSETAGADVSEKLTPYLEKANEQLKEFSKWYKELSPEQKEFAQDAAAIAAVLGSIVISLGAIKGVKNILGAIFGKGGKGGALGAGGVVPVYVTNMGGLGGPGGMDIPGDKKPKTKLGKLASVASVIIPAAAGGYAVDAAAGALGVGDKSINPKQDDSNWDRMTWPEKVESGVARAVERAAEWMFLDNFANQAKADRIKTETEYLDKQPPTKSSNNKEVKTDTKSTLAGTIYEGLANFVAGGESGKAGYSAYNSGTKGVKDGKVGHSGSKDLENMTLNQIMATYDLSGNDKNRIFAAGRYQITPDTMKGLVKNLKLTGNEKFTKELQDRMFVSLIPKKAMDYIHRKSSDAQGAMLALAKEWRSIADPRTGKTYADNAAKANRALHSPQATLGAINTARNAYSVNGGTQITQNNPVTIHGVTSPAEAAQAVRSAMDDANARLYRNSVPTIV